MKNVFITGADRGIGQALTVEFLSHGYYVYAGQFMPEWPALEELKETYPETLQIIPLDVSSTESVKNAYEQIRQTTDRIDLLVNVAGISGTMEPEKVKQTYDVNAVGAIRMVDTFLPLMEAGEKELCFVSSEAGSIALSDRDDMEHWLAYCSSKSMLNMAIRLMFNELNEKGWKFRVYHPGGVNGYMSGKKGTGSDYEPEETAKVAFRQFVTERSFEDVLILSDVEDTIWAF